MTEGRRPGAGRRKRKAPAAGSGGQGRRRLEGRGPTPRAEDRPHHPAARARERAERQAAAAPRPRHQQTEPASRGERRPTVHKRRGTEVIGGRNAVVEALAARVPATTLYVAERVEADDRVRDALSRAAGRGIPVQTVTRAELDTLVGEGAVHQGIALQIPPYRYATLQQIVAGAREHRGRSAAAPLVVALDGITDPRNLGAIIRSAAAFGADGVIIPERRSAGVTAAAWKTSAGAALRTRVAMVPNLTRALRELKQEGLFVIGLDGGGRVSLPGLELATEPLVIVVGSEGKGLSRLVGETCDEIVSIPIVNGVESLNAGVAAAVALYEVARDRGAAG
jgi:23S rRNA (guanosine2251-2'-O)-methyltransferase